jgi:hypothetical protein
MRLLFQPVWYEQRSSASFLFIAPGGMIKSKQDIKPALLYAIFTLGTSQEHSGVKT